METMFFSPYFKCCATPITIPTAPPPSPMATFAQTLTLIPSLSISNPSSSLLMKSGTSNPIIIVIAKSSVPVETLTHSDLSRRQNARSTALFLLHYQGTAVHGSKEEELDEEELQRKKVIEEASLASKRIARFPGSIDFPKPEQFGSPVDLNRVAFESDEEDIWKAIEVRRGVAAEIMKEALRAGKLSVNYSTNLVSRLSGFVDKAVIEVATVKGVLEFKQVSFNARAKSYIQSSGVVALVKYKFCRTQASKKKLLVVPPLLTYSLYKKIRPVVLPSELSIQQTVCATHGNCPLA